LSYGVLAVVVDQVVEVHQALFDKVVAVVVVVLE
jgi:hypothetical protein